MADSEEALLKVFIVYVYEVAGLNGEKSNPCLYEMTRCCLSSFDFPIGTEFTSLEYFFTCNKRFISVFLLQICN